MEHCLWWTLLWQYRLHDEFSSLFTALLIEVLRWVVARVDVFAGETCWSELLRWLRCIVPTVEVDGLWRRLLFCPAGPLPTWVVRPPPMYSKKTTASLAQKTQRRRGNPASTFNLHFWTSLLLLQRASCRCSFHHVNGRTFVPGIKDWTIDRIAQHGWTSFIAFTLKVQTTWVPAFSWIHQIPQYATATFCLNFSLLQRSARQNGFLSINDVWPLRVEANQNFHQNSPTERMLPYCCH